MNHSDLQEGQIVVVKRDNDYLPVGSIFKVEWVEGEYESMHASPKGIYPLGGEGRLWLYDYISFCLEVVNDNELWWR